MLAIATRIAALTVLSAAAFVPSAGAIEGNLGSIKVCSKTQASKCTSGPVRVTDVGKQVRLPGGTWVDCAGDCREKLRIKTVDFWYEQMLQN
jgi:hypothetical protein